MMTLLTLSLSWLGTTLLSWSSSRESERGTLESSRLGLSQLNKYHNSFLLTKVTV